MILEQLTKNLNITQCIGNLRVDISGVCSDSRRVAPGNLFVAVRGPQSDGHNYIAKAVEGGCSAVVCEQIPADASSQVCWICVADSATALGLLASAWYGEPSRHLRLVGVTGTNGKTTVATLLYEAAILRGEKAGLLSTVENRVNHERYPAHNTTPSPLEINRLLRQMVDCGCTFAAMEVSSHGQVQRRTAGLHWSGAVFTNLTRDHLDYHKTVDNYLRAKKSFFDELPKTAWALVNADDSKGAVMLQNCKARHCNYSMRGPADFTARAVESRIDGTLLRVNGHDVETRFTGRFNAYNLLAVFGALVLDGMEAFDAAILLSRLVPVSGRFETFSSSDRVTVVVDYAHTPDALANVLAAIAEVKPSDASVTTVTGAGGNRDHGKRPMMGAEAARQSDRVIITSDNPRDEDPTDIAEDIRAGIPVDSPTRVDIILERAAAIHAAVAEAAPGDVILIAGKGHEDYQEFEGGRRIHFDDREQAKRALAARDAEIAEQSQSTDK